MKPSDCPYPVGTPDHSNWIRTVLIPAEASDEDIMMAHRERAGIERLGGTVTWDARDVSPEDELLGIQDEAVQLFGYTHKYTVDMTFYQDLQSYRAFMDDIFNQMRKVFEEMAKAVKDASDVFDQEFIKGSDLSQDLMSILDDGENHKQHQKKRKEMCIPHGSPKSSCRKCHRR